MSTLTMEAGGNSEKFVPFTFNFIPTNKRQSSPVTGLDGLEGG
jgi:hypothetical protein